SDKQLWKIDDTLVETVRQAEEIVAGAVLRDRGLFTMDQAGVLSDQGDRLGKSTVTRKQALGHRIAIGESLGRETCPVVQMKADRMDIVLGGAVPQRVRARRIVRQHPPELAHVAAGGIGAEHQPV